MAIYYVAQISAMKSYTNYKNKEKNFFSNLLLIAPKILA